MRSVPINFLKMTAKLSIYSENEMAMSQIRPQIET